MKRLAILLLAVVAALGAHRPAAAQDGAFPSRPATLIVPTAPGGPIDSLSRVLVEAMARDLGQPVVVQNIPGAGFTIGAAAAARAAPDGHTLLIHHIGMATSPALYRNLGFDPRSSFAPIGLVTELPLMLVVRRDLAAQDARGLLALVRAQGPRFNLAHAGNGSASQLCGLLFLSAAGARVTEVPYRGTAPALNDVVGGQVDMLCDSPTGATVGLVETGRIRVLMTPSAARLPMLPGVETSAEAGLPGFALGIWHGLYAPQGTPAPVVARLTRTLQAALRDERFVERLAILGAQPMPQERATPEALRAHLEAELDRWGTLIRGAGIQPE